jgi:hypothetical protein
MPILDVFWSMLLFFLFVAWIWVMIAVIADIFRSHDMGGASKALWMIFVIIVPWLGVLLYLIARGDGMAKRNMEAAAAAQDAQRAYIQEAAGGPSAADELTKLSSLKASGVISEAEFNAQKAKLLA